MNRKERRAAPKQKIVEPKSDPVPEVVERCEQLLKLARSGRLTTLVAAGDARAQGDDPAAVLSTHAGTASTAQDLYLLAVACGACAKENRAPGIGG